MISDPLVQLVMSLVLPKSNCIPPSNEEIGLTTDLPWDKEGKVSEFLRECEKYGFKTRSKQVWYANLIQKASLCSGDFCEMLDLEIKYNQQRYERNELNHRKFTLFDEYRRHSSWVLKLREENLLDYSTKENKETKG